jgi:hypothetical protein
MSSKVGRVSRSEMRKGGFCSNSLKIKITR